MYLPSPPSAVSHVFFLVNPHFCLADIRAGGVLSHESKLLSHGSLVSLLFLKNLPLCILIPEPLGRASVLLLFCVSLTKDHVRKGKMRIVKPPYYPYPPCRSYNVHFDDNSSPFLMSADRDCTIYEK